ncbi:hypothetical protein BBJ28_00005250 [Nothophytophthora sp. Chile5]|nr:hypothetical protein BBJ28_00005250 [Nothophytophthora sp. Chile5]
MSISNRCSLDLDRKEKENKTLEMQKMIGVRYRDLIESADKIVNMHSAALRLEVSLKEMPEKWKRMEEALTSALAPETCADAIAEKEPEEACAPRGDSLDHATVAEKVAFLVEMPEKMWQLLDAGETLQALQLYQRSNEIRGEPEMSAAEQEFPFLPAQWTCIQCFRPTISTTMTQTEDIFGNGSSSGLLTSIFELPLSFKDGLEKFVSSGKLLKMLNAWFRREQLQNSFVEALEAIKTQIRGNLGEMGAGNPRSDYRLQSVKFYDYFEIIQKKAADLDASDLQSVLTEEFLRTLLKMVVFFEQEYPLFGDRQACANQGDSGELAQDPGIFLGISNIFAGIVAGFPGQMDKLFPGTTVGVSIPERDPSLLSVRPVFDKYADNGVVGKKQLASAWQEILADVENSTPCFIDEELKRVDALGFHSFYLVCEIKRKASYPQLFVNVLHGMSKKYCEAWAILLLEQKIQPLRELMQIEQYDSTNEVRSLSTPSFPINLYSPYWCDADDYFYMQDWIATHEGWVEQVISDEGFGGGDTDDSSSEAEMALGEEKVWLPWCETPTVSSFLFSCCYSLDDANQMIRSSIGAEEQIKLMQRTIREVLVDQLTITSAAVYDAAVSLLVDAKATQKDSVLNFGECCIQQFLFDMYFVRATLGFSDFIRFGWGDELNPEECSPGLLKLKGLFERMQEFIDPVDWEIYGPQLIENVVLQFRKSRLLFSSLSESNDINKISKLAGCVILLRAILLSRH